MGFKVTVVEPVTKAATKPAPVAKTTPTAKASVSDVDRQNRERWKAESISELIDAVLAEAEGRHMTLADAASWVLETPRGAKLVEDYANLGGGELTAGKLARLAADRGTAASAAKSAAPGRLGRQLADLAAVSKACEALAERKGVRHAYEANERAARVIRDGGSLVDAFKLIG